MDYRTACVRKIHGYNALWSLNWPRIGIDAAVLESDAMRQVFTPEPTYSEKERTLFYGQMVWVGALLVRHGVPVVFDATANRRSLRQSARQAIARFIEVYVHCPVEVCMARDPKGIYRLAQQAGSSSVPGLHVPYEAPENPDVVVEGDAEDPPSAARRIVAKLIDKRYLAAGSSF